MIKEHLEFFSLDFSNGWERPEGYPEGVDQKIISGLLDEENKKGTRTRILRFAPGAFTLEPFEHNYWEEVFLFTGDLKVQGVTYQPYTYACRPPFTPHGPFASENGCMLIETHFYSELE
ncbi:MAG: cupin domain-containing protein [Pseudomonadota bacterium]